jgi:hypothetical protein
VAIAVAAHREAVREDTAIGVVFSAMFALGILVISTQRSFRDLSHVLFGNVLGIDDADLVALAVIAVIAVTLLAVFHKELELTTVDPVHAAAIGLSPEWIRIGLLLLLAPVVVAGIQAVGIVMLSALLARADDGAVGRRWGALVLPRPSDLVPLRRLGRRRDRAGRQRLLRRRVDRRPRAARGGGAGGSRHRGCRRGGGRELGGLNSQFAAGFTENRRATWACPPTPSRSSRPTPTLIGW